MTDYEPDVIETMPLKHPRNADDSSQWGPVGFEYTSYASFKEKDTLSLSQALFFI